MAKIHYLSPKFAARVARPGEKLYHGQTQDLTRTPSDFERSHTIIEIYDRRYLHTPIGQFVTAYGADTLAQMRPGQRLSTHSDIADWTLSVDETAQVAEIARQSLQ